jgi:hypothetical protein
MSDRKPPGTTTTTGTTAGTTAASSTRAGRVARLWARVRRRSEARLGIADVAAFGAARPSVAQRLRGFLLVRLVEGVAASWGLLLAARNLDAALLLALIPMVGALLRGSFFGALEPTRQRLRRLLRQDRADEAVAVVDDAVRHALLAGGVVGAVGLLAAVAVAADEGALRGASVAIVSATLRVVLDLPARAVHAGVWAVRRVPRTLPGLLAPGLGELAVLAAGVAADVGAASVFVAHGAGQLLASALSLRALWLAARQQGLWPALLRRWSRRRSRRAPKQRRRSDRATTRRFWADAWRPGLAAGTGPLALGIVWLAIARGATHELDAEAARQAFVAGVVVVVAWPLFEVAAGWAQLLLFDLLRLGQRRWDHARRSLVRGGFVVGGALAAACGALIVAFATRTALAPATAIALALFCVARGLLAFAQAAAFAAGLWARLAVVNACVLVAGGVATTMALPWRLAALVAALLGAALVLGRRHPPGPDDDIVALERLAALAVERPSSLLLVIDVDHRGSAAPADVARQLRHEPGVVAVALAGARGRRLVALLDRPLAAATVATAVAGAARRVSQGPATRDALLRLLPEGEGHDVDDDIDVGALRLAPDAALRRAVFDQLEGRDLRHVPATVAAFCPGGVVEEVFVFAATKAGRAAARRVRRRSLLASLGATSAEAVATERERASARPAQPPGGDGAGDDPAGGAAAGAAAAGDDPAGDAVRQPPPRAS